MPCAGKSAREREVSLVDRRYLVYKLALNIDKITIDKITWYEVIVA